MQVTTNTSVKITTTWAIMTLRTGATIEIIEGTWEDAYKRMTFLQKRDRIGMYMEGITL